MPIGKPWVENVNKMKFINLTRNVVICSVAMILTGCGESETEKLARETRVRIAESEARQKASYDKHVKGLTNNAFTNPTPVQFGPVTNDTKSPSKPAMATKDGK